MKILFNCTTNIVGGGIKNSALFIKYACWDQAIDWIFAVSAEVKGVLDGWGIHPRRLVEIHPSPARSLVSRKTLKELAERHGVDLVFTMAGPAYLAFEKCHVMGISNPYISHLDFHVLFASGSFITSLKLTAQLVYTLRFARKADYFIFQTHRSRNGFCSRFFLPKERSVVIANAFDFEFLEYFRNQSTKSWNPEGKVRIFCPAASFWHKGLQFIPGIARELADLCRGGYDFEFILTLDRESDLYQKLAKKSRKMKVNEKIRTVGSYRYSEAKLMYEQADIVFVPSLLETFSACYLEAFAAQKPLVASDRSFSREICRNAALYIEPQNPLKSAAAIHQLAGDRQLQKQLIHRGNEVLMDYGDQKDRYHKICLFLKEVSDRERDASCR